MSEARRRIQLFEIEIRRSQRERIISKLRKDFIDAENISQQFEIFVMEKQSEVPKSVAEGITLVSKEAIEQFMGILESSSTVYDNRMKGKANVWYFDCLSKNNLKFIGGLCKHQNQNNTRVFYKKFTVATIKAHEEYKTLTYTFQLMVQDSQCLIVPQHLKLQGLNERNPLLEILNKSYDQQKFLAVIDYWAAYLDIETSFDLQELIIMIKTFLFWFQHTEIHEKEPTYDFILQIFNILQQSAILTTNNQSQGKEFIETLSFFVDRIKNFLPFAFAKLNFKQLGEILLRIIESKIQGLLSALLFRSETIIRYLQMIYSQSVDNNTIPTIKMAMIIVSNIANSNSLLQFQDNKDQRVEFFKKIATEYIYYSELQGISIIVLRQLLNTELQNEIKEICEALVYSRVMTVLHFSNQENALYLMVQSLRSSRQNKKVYDKILKDAELMRRMKRYCLEYAQCANLAQALALVIDSNINFFVDNYMNDVNAMRDIAREVSFEGKEVFLQETEKYINLKIKEDSL